MGPLMVAQAALRAKKAISISFRARRPAVEQPIAIAHSLRRLSKLRPELHPWIIVVPSVAEYSQLQNSEAHYIPTGLGSIHIQRMDDRQLVEFLDVARRELIEIDLGRAQLLRLASEPLRILAPIELGIDQEVLRLPLSDHVEIRKIVGMGGERCSRNQHQRESRSGLRHSTPLWKMRYPHRRAAARDSKRDK